MSSHMSSQSHLLIIISHHSTKYPLHVFHPSQSSFRIKPSLERRQFVSHETIKPPLLCLSLVFLTMTTIPLILSQSLSLCSQSCCNRIIIPTISASHLTSNQQNQATCKNNNKTAQQVSKVTQHTIRIQQVIHRVLVRTRPTWLWYQSF